MHELRKLETFTRVAAVQRVLETMHPCVDPPVGPEDPSPENPVGGVNPEDSADENPQDITVGVCAEVVQVPSFLKGLAYKGMQGVVTRKCTPTTRQLALKQIMSPLFFRIFFLCILIVFHCLQRPNGQRNRTRCRLDACEGRKGGREEGGEAEEARGGRKVAYASYWLPTSKNVIHPIP